MTEDDPFRPGKIYHTPKDIAVAGRPGPAGAMLVSPLCVLRIWCTNTIYGFAKIDFAIAEC